MTDAFVAGSAALLYAAARDGRLVDLLSVATPTLGVTQGYAIQDALVALHIADGATVTGAKLGLTSIAKQVEMQVHEPIGGWLTDVMALPEGEPLVVSSLVQPRCEPEIAFLLGADLAGPDVAAADVLAATASVSVAIEVLDSRYRDYRFTLPDVIADDASAARFVVGPPVPPDGVDLRGCAVTFHINDVLMGSATGAAVMGDPAEAVAWWVRHLAGSGRGLRAGMVVLSGALMGAQKVAPGDQVRATIEGLGTLQLACRSIRVGIIGHGFIGAELVRRLMASGDLGLEAAFVHARGAADGVPQELLLRDVEDAGTRGADLIVEAAHPDITRTHGERILGVADYLPLSVTALADDGLRGVLAAAAQVSGRRLLLPHGALVGAGSLAEWREHWRSVTFRMEKPPASLNLRAAGVAAPDIQTRTVLHDGSVRSIAARFPRNVNAMVTGALVSIGLDRARGVLVADPSLTELRLTVDARGHDGSRLRITRSQPATGVSGTEMAESAWASVLAAAGRQPAWSVV